jgi:ABC-type cobalamin/Fe3+-siderophores transport system ATPase subunit
MLTLEDFPYITAIHVNDCYAYQNFDITLNDDKPFSHLVLTGKNGSGKSTILRGINGWIWNFQQGIGDKYDGILVLGYENYHFIREIFFNSTLTDYVFL